VKLSFSRALCADRPLGGCGGVDCDDDRIRFNPGRVGRVGPGFVPDRIRDSGCCGAFSATTGGSSIEVLSCAADIDGRNSFRGVDDPLDGEVSEVMSSPFAEGPAEEKDEPFWDLLSVEELPDRLRFMYFSMASASRSRMRVATGERENVGLAGALRRDGCDSMGEVTENVLEVPVADRLKEEGIWKKLLGPMDCIDGGGDEEAENDDWLGGRCECVFVPSISPLSDVAVVRLVPDPLRILGIRRMSRAFDGGGGGGGGGGGKPIFSEAHSLPLATGCCARMRRDFLLFSNCIRAVSCSVSLVLKLNNDT